MVPAAFVALDALPLTPNGKVDRKALPAPGRARPELERELRGARATPVEERSPRIWAEVLGRERVGVHDNFFDLGGDSILAIRLVGAMRGHGLEVAVQELFKHPTIAGLAAADLRRGARRTRSCGWLLSSCCPRRTARRSRRTSRTPTRCPWCRWGCCTRCSRTRAVALYQNITCYLVRDTGPFSLPALREAARRLTSGTSCCAPRSRSPPTRNLCNWCTARRWWTSTWQRPAGLDGAAQKPPWTSTSPGARQSPFDPGQPAAAAPARSPGPGRRVVAVLVECHAILDGWSHNSGVSELIRGTTACRATSGRGGRPRRPPSGSRTSSRRSGGRCGRPGTGAFWAEPASVTHDRLALPAGVGGPRRRRGALHERPRPQRRTWSRGCASWLGAPGYR